MRVVQGEVHSVVDGAGWCGACSSSGGLQVHFVSLEGGSLMIPRRLRRHPRRPLYVLEAEGRLTAEEAAMIREQWMKFYSQPRSNSALILSGGMTLKEIRP